MGTERYVFTAEGHGNVIKAYDTIANAAERAGERVDKAFRHTSPATRPNAEARELARAQSRGLATVQRAEQQKTAMIEREAAKRRARVTRNEDREIRDLEKRLHREQRLVERVEKVKAKTAERIANKARSERQRRWDRGRDYAFGAVAGATTLTAYGAARVTGRVLSDGADLQDRATRLAIQGREPKKAIALREGFEATAVGVRGAKAADVATGVEAFVAKTGQLQIAQDFQRLMAETAVATGASAGDIGDAMADLYSKFDIKTVDEMSRAMATLAVQGKQGSFELKDAASQYPKLAAAAQRLGIGKGADAVGVLGGLTQIARGSTGDPRSAATALEATFRQLTAKSPELKQKYGVSVFDQKGNARDIRDILTETIGKVGGKDVAKKKVGLQKIFGEEGIRAISPLISTFADAATNGADGMAAVRAELDRNISTIGAEAEIRADLVEAQKTDSAALTHAWETMSAAISQQATPALVALSTQIADGTASIDFEAFGRLTASAITLTGAFVSMADKALNSLGLAPKVKAETSLANASAEIARLERARETIIPKDLHALMARHGDDERAGLPADKLRQLDTIDAQLKKQRAIAGAAEIEQNMLTESIRPGRFVDELSAVGDDTDRSRLWAEKIAKDIQADPTNYDSGDATQPFSPFGPLTGNTDAAQQLIRQFVESQILDQQPGGPSDRAAADAAAAANAEKLATSLATAAAAADGFRPTGVPAATPFW